jgi:hypothetical protein
MAELRRKGERNIMTTTTEMPAIAKEVGATKNRKHEKVLPEQLEIEITVSLDDPIQRTLKVSADYVKVGIDQTVVIKWVLAAGTFGKEVFFDCPGITFFGENAPAYEWTHGQKEITVSWNNADPTRRKHSYFYRIHVLDVDNNIYRLDPIVHNEPPSYEPPSYA